MLRLDNVHAFYGPVQVLFSIDLEVNDGEIVALLGTNGAGKTTILRVISGVKHPALGDVVWNGESIKGLRPPDVLRRRIVQMPGGLMQVARLQWRLIRARPRVGIAAAAAIIGLNVGLAWLFVRLS